MSSSMSSKPDDDLAGGLARSRRRSARSGCRRTRGVTAAATTTAIAALRITTAATLRVAAVVLGAARWAALALTAAEHLHLVGADFGGVLFDAVLVGPLARAQASFDIHLRALAQVLAGDFGQAAVEDDAVPLGGFAHFAALLVFPAIGGGHCDVRDLVAAREGTHFGVAPQIADDDDFIDRCHMHCP